MNLFNETLTHVDTRGTGPASRFRVKASASAIRAPFVVQDANSEKHHYTRLKR